MNRLALLGIIGWTALAMGCDPGSGGGGGGSGTKLEALSAAFGAMCDRAEACGDEFGRWYESAQACRDLLGGIFPEVAEADITASIADLDACAAAVAATACSAIFGGEAVTGCEVMDGIFSTPPSQIGQECGRCADGASCWWQPARGGGCYACTADAALSQSCNGATCATDSVCAAGVCVAESGFPCSFDTDCPGDYFCDAGAADTCAARVSGSPCGSPQSDSCDVDGLACVAGLCAAPGAAGAACDTKDDCNSVELACIQGSCQTAKARGAACASSQECKARLLCNTTCGDAPVPGEACPEGVCLSPGYCFSGQCISLVFNGPPLALGDICSDATCGPICSLSYGECADSYCDAGGTDLCTAYVAEGQPCPTFHECDPATSYCSGNSCTAYIALGAACFYDEQCGPSATCTADGAGNTLCTAKIADGQPCTDGARCLNGYCYGNCSGGDFDTLPCTADWDCTNGSCAGSCGPENVDWSDCAPL